MGISVEVGWGFLFGNCEKVFAFIWNILLTPKRVYSPGIPKWSPVQVLRRPYPAYLPRCSGKTEWPSQAHVVFCLRLNYFIGLTQV